MTNQTSYRTQFGEPPKAAEDYVILKQKKLRDLEISKYMKESTKNYIEQWLKINDQDEFTKRIYFTLREIYTVVRNLEAPINSNKSFFTGRKAERVPRFDKILLEAQHGDRLRSMGIPKPQQPSQTDIFLERVLGMQTAKSKHINPLIDTKSFK